MGAFDVFLGQFGYRARAVAIPGSQDPRIPRSQDPTIPISGSQEPRIPSSHDPVDPRIPGSEDPRIPGSQDPTIPRPRPRHVFGNIAQQWRKWTREKINTALERCKFKKKKSIRPHRARRQESLIRISRESVRFFFGSIWLSRASGRKSSSTDFFDNSEIQKMSNLLLKPL